jgi:hypothetical protein
MQQIQNAYGMHENAASEECSRSRMHENATHKCTKNATCENARKCNFFSECSRFENA